MMIHVNNLLKDYKPEIATDKCSLDLKISRYMQEQMKLVRNKNLKNVDSE